MWGDFLDIINRVGSHGYILDCNSHNQLSSAIVEVGMLLCLLAVAYGASNDEKEEYVVGSTLSHDCVWPRYV